MFPIGIGCVEAGGAQLRDNPTDRNDEMNAFELTYFFINTWKLDSKECMFLSIPSLSFFLPFVQKKIN